MKAGPRRRRLSTYALAPVATGLALAAAMLLGSAAPARATACCEVKRTSDGFLAMRSGPGARFALLKKIPSGDAVCFGSRDPDEPDTGHWIYGFYTDASGQTYHGWVNDLYLFDECG